MLNSVVTQAGGRPVMVRSGNTFIRQAVQSPEYDAAFGAEFSGHYFFNDGRSNNNDDGLYAALRLLEWLDQQGQSIAEMLKALPQRVSTPDLYIPLDGTDGRQLLADLQDSAEVLGEGQLSLLDGIRLDFNDGFGIIRASNTGPYLTARFDGETPEALIRIRQVFQGLVSQHHPTLAKHLVD
jgi:phosphomannomutase